MLQKSPFVHLAAIFGLLIFTVGIDGCGGRQFDVVRTATLSVVAGQDLSQLNFVGLSPLMLFDDLLLREQSAGRGDLNQVKLRRMTMTAITPGSGQDFTFLSGLSVQMQAPGLPPLTVATADSFFAGQNLVALDVSTSPLMDYFATSNPQVVLAAPGQTAPQDMTLRVEMTLALDVSSGKILVK